jgi:hypothetical protein
VRSDRDERRRSHRFGTAKSCPNAPRVRVRHSRTATVESLDAGADRATSTGPEPSTSSATPCTTRRAPNLGEAHMIGRRPSERTCVSHRANSLRRDSCAIPTGQSFNAFIPPTDPGVVRPAPGRSPSAPVVVVATTAQKAMLAMGGGVLGVGDEGPPPPPDSRSRSVNWQPTEVVLGRYRSLVGSDVNSNAIGAA